MASAGGRSAAQRLVDVAGGSLICASATSAGLTSGQRASRATSPFSSARGPVSALPDATSGALCAGVCCTPERGVVARLLHALLRAITNKAAALSEVVARVVACAVAPGAPGCCTLHSLGRATCNKSVVSFIGSPAWPRPLRCGSSPRPPPVASGGGRSSGCIRAPGRSRRGRAPRSPALTTRSKVVSSTLRKSHRPRPSSPTTSWASIGVVASP